MPRPGGRLGRTQGARAAGPRRDSATPPPGGWIRSCRDSAIVVAHGIGRRATFLVIVLCCTYTHIYTNEMRCRKCLRRCRVCLLRAFANYVAGACDQELLMCYVNCVCVCVCSPWCCIASVLGCLSQTRLSSVLDCLFKRAHASTDLRADMRTMCSRAHPAPEKALLLFCRRGICWGEVWRRGAPQGRAGGEGGRTVFAEAAAEGACGNGASQGFWLGPRIPPDQSTASAAGPVRSGRLRPRHCGTRGSRRPPPSQPPPSPSSPAGPGQARPGWASSQASRRMWVHARWHAGEHERAQPAANGRCDRRAGWREWGTSWLMQAPLGGTESRSEARCPQRGVLQGCHATRESQDGRAAREPGMATQPGAQKFARIVKTDGR